MGGSFLEILKLALCKPVTAKNQNINKRFPDLNIHYVNSN